MRKDEKYGKVRSAAEPVVRYAKSSKNGTAEVILGDALKNLIVMEDEKFDLIITSPPYNVGKEYEKKQSIEKYLLTQKPILKELVRVLSETGSICWQIGNYIEKCI